MGRWTRVEIVFFVLFGLPSKLDDSGLLRCIGDGFGGDDL